MFDYAAEDKTWWPPSRWIYCEASASPEHAALHTTHWICSKPSSDSKSRGLQKTQIFTRHYNFIAWDQNEKSFFESIDICCPLFAGSSDLWWKSRLYSRPGGDIFVIFLSIVSWVSSVFFEIIQRFFVFIVRIFSFSYILTSSNSNLTFWLKIPW